MPWGPSADVSGMETVTAVLLRTPGLFVIDYWYWFQKNKSDAESSSFTTEMVAYFALANGFLLLLLPISQLRTFYSHFVCGALVLVAHLLSHCIVRHGTPDTDPPLITDPSIAVAEAAEKIVGEVVPDSAIVKLLSLLLLHVVMAMIVSCLLRGHKKPVLPIMACYSLPVMARLADVPVSSIQILHNLCFVVAGITIVRYCNCYSFSSLFSSLKGTCNTIITSITSIHGLVELVISFVGKIFVPIHFLLFCVISFSIKLQRIPFSDTSNHKSEAWFVTILSAAAAVCDSPVSLLSIAVTVTYVSHIFLSAVKMYLSSFGYRPHVIPHHDIQDENPDQIHFHHIGPNDHRANQVQARATHTGWEEGVTTLLLAVLTGITELGHTARMAVLTIIFFVVISSLLQSMLEIAEPVILSLSAHNGKNLLHHVKVLMLCAFLFAFPLHITYVLTTVFPVDFWLAVVLSTSLLTSAQVLDLVVVHCLLWFDATRSEPWDPLDEVVYYVRAFTKVIEFMVAFSVVVVGVYEGMTGQWNWTNALILIVHCYVNVCQRFQSGLRSFIQRRKAVQKSSKLPAATLFQLQKHRDICAICFMDMITVSSSVITPCCHFFHRVCLRRWLSFHDRCPLCASPVISDALSKDLPDCDTTDPPAALD